MVNFIGTDIYCVYKIEKAPETLQPNDEIEGVFILENRDKKDKKLKKAILKINELYLEKVIYQDPESGEETKKYEDRKKTLKEEELVKADKIKSGEKKEIKFKIKMPSFWSKKRKIRLKIGD